MKRIVAVVSFLLLCGCLQSAAQESSQVGTSMANFLKIGVGPRATAMGDALVAMSDDASALYWNPAGLGYVKKNELLMQSTTWIGDTKLYFLGIVFPLGEFGTLGASVDYFTSGDMEETTIQQPDGTGRTFGTHDLALGVSYAKRLTDRFSVGVTVKYVSESLSRETAEAVAFDVGSVYTTSFLNEMKLGIALSNLGGSMKVDGPDLIVSHDVAPDVPTNKSVDASLATQSWDLPLTFRIGVGTFVYQTDASALSLEAGVNDSRDFQPRYNVGSELTVRVVGEQKVMFRLGYKGNYDEEGLTAGGGIVVNLSGFDFKMDYGYASFSRLGSVHRYAVSILF
jgi:hypothetical protein